VVGEVVGLQTPRLALLSPCLAVQGSRRRAGYIL
jgi:hypothetical protein